MIEASAVSGLRHQLGEVAVVAERATGQPREACRRRRCQARLADRSGSAASVRRSVGAVGAARASRENASRSSKPGKRVGQHMLIQTAIATLVNSSTVSAGPLSSVRHADQRLPAEQHCATTPLAANDRSMSARSAWPSSNASPQRDRNARAGRRRNRLRPTPASCGTSPKRDDQDRVAQREEQRRDHDVAHHRSRAAADRTPRRSHRTERRQRDRTEHHPVTEPQRAVDGRRPARRRAAATARRRRRRSRISPARLRQVSQRPRQFEQHREPRHARHGNRDRSRCWRAHPAHDDRGTRRRAPPLPRNSY
mgnify:CR=1 FL=1